MYWPLFQDFYYCTIKPKITIVEVNREDKYGKSIESTWAIQYRVRDCYKAMFEVESYTERLSGYATKIIGECIEKGERVDSEALSKIREGISGFGLWLNDVYPQQFTHVTPYKLFLEKSLDKTEET